MTALWEDGKRGAARDQALTEGERYGATLQRQHPDLKAQDHEARIRTAAGIRYPMSPELKECFRVGAISWLEETELE